VSIKYVGDVVGANGPYPNFRVSRKSAPAEATGATDDEAPKDEREEADDDIGF
jgi:hypothetical protein